MVGNVLMYLTGRTIALEVLLTDLSARSLSGTKCKCLVFLGSVTRPCTLHTISDLRADLEFLEEGALFLSGK